jgi:FkbH-like protein
VRHHEHRQRLLKRLAENGIVLCAVSKNDPRNIRWSEMLLGPDDFAAQKIGWNLKSQSIRELSAELNLGRDSFALIDDDPSERGLAKEQVPELTVLDANAPETWRGLERLLSMPNTSGTEEARQRTRKYREQMQRAGAVRAVTDYAAVMRSLDLRARIGRMKKADLERAGELVARTSQFNTTTIRYTRAELQALLRDPGRTVLAGELEDRFGNLGLVGLAVVAKTEDEAVIESFVMSCRAMGFGFERALLAAAVAAAENRTLVGRFTPSDKNEPASGLYRSAGFVHESAGRWVKPKEVDVGVPDWIAVSAR